MDVNKGKIKRLFFLDSKAASFISGHHFIQLVSFYDLMEL